MLEGNVHSLNLNKIKTNKLSESLDTFKKRNLEKLSEAEKQANMVYNELNRIITDYAGHIRINSSHEAEAHDMVRRKIGDAVWNIDRRTLNKVIERFRDDIVKNRALYSKNNFRAYLIRVIVVVHIAKMKRCK